MGIAIIGYGPEASEAPWPPSRIARTRSVKWDDYNSVLSHTLIKPHPVIFSVSINNLIQPRPCHLDHVSSIVSSLDTSLIVLDKLDKHSSRLNKLMDLLSGRETGRQALRPTMRALPQSSIQADTPSSGKSQARFPAPSLVKSRRTKLSRRIQG